MPWIKSLLLHLYYGMQYPQRRLADSRRAAAGRAPVLVLCYHRIADDMATPWTQSNRSFARQIDWLARHFEMISLSEAQQRLRCGRNHRTAVSITFDDGYSANCSQALPLLIRKKIPFTYFVSTRNVFEGAPFPHDVAINRRLAPNTLDELRALAEAGVEIGAHTRTHADLGRINDPEQIYEEVVVSGRELADAIGQNIRYFAFPFGWPVHLNAAAFAMAKESGYEAVCSAYGGYNFPGDDPFHLQRIMVDQFFIRLKNWVTVDPRKLSSVQRFEYESVFAEETAAAGANPV